MEEKRLVPDQERYEPPTLRELGSVDEFTAGDTDSIVTTITI